MAKKQVPITVNRKYSAILKKIRSVLLLVLLSLFILEISLRLGGHVFLFIQERRNKASLSKNHTYKILCLGESTTALGGENSYPSQLERILNQKSSRIKFSVINKGVPAIRTYEMLLQLEDVYDFFLLCFFKALPIFSHIVVGCSSIQSQDRIYVFFSIRV